MAGTVASPTPTVRMSGDSTTVMVMFWRARRPASQVAAIHPAVPPPTTRIDRIGWDCVFMIAPKMKNRACRRQDADRLAEGERLAQ
jgi:hypothetical protein